MSKRHGTVALLAAMATGSALSACTAPNPGPSPTIAPPATGEQVIVTRAVDGDTMAVGTRRIRVLGINSCEKKTPGGSRATADAVELLHGTVTLTKEPGVDLDRYGRELRYVSVNGQDFGALMVAHDHTEVYRGHNDASPQYVQRLRELDTDGRNCDR